MDSSDEDESYYMQEELLQMLEEHLKMQGASTSEEMHDTACGISECLYEKPCTSTSRPASDERKKKISKQPPPKKPENPFANITEEQCIKQGAVPERFLLAREQRAAKAKHLRRLDVSKYPINFPIMLRRSAKMRSEEYKYPLGFPEEKGKAIDAVLVAHSIPVKPSVATKEIAEAFNQLRTEIAIKHELVGLIKEGEHEKKDDKYLLDYLRGCDSLDEEEEEEEEEESVTEPYEEEEPERPVFLELDSDDEPPKVKKPVKEDDNLDLKIDLSLDEVEKRVREMKKDL